MVGIMLDGICTHRVLLYRLYTFITNIKNEEEKTIDSMVSKILCMGLE